MCTTLSKSLKRDDGEKYSLYSQLKIRCSRQIYQLHVLLNFIAYMSVSSMIPAEAEREKERYGQRKCIGRKWCGGVMMWRKRKEEKRLVIRFYYKFISLHEGKKCTHVYRRVLSRFTLFNVVLSATGVNYSRPGVIFFPFRLINYQRRRKRKRAE